MSDSYIEIVEEPSGVGRVLDVEGRVLAEGVEYDLLVTQQMFVGHGRTGAPPVAGTRNVHGWLRELPVELHGRLGDPVVLELEDCRRWACYVETDAGDLAGRQSGLVPSASTH